ncbi:MAG: hypothetical protein Crog4KO_16670 [Crocinitomicaceae bacterium]
MIRGLLLLAFIGLTTFAKADQLAYISKEDAEEVAAYLNKGKTVYLFCGCCSLVEPVKVRVESAKAVYTGYEDYWEVEISYEKTDEKIHMVSEAIDLAYVWKKGLFGYKTIGKKFKMDHDYCVKLKEWDDPKHIEKDI